MNIREIRITDFDCLQKLYLHLHETENLSLNSKISSLWQSIIDDENYHILVLEIREILISSVTLIIIPNLTRGGKPFAIIENVVTHKDYRNKGYAKMLMQKASKIAETAGCYKIMLMTGSKEESTLSFYEKCGFNSKDKTAYIKWIGRGDDLSF